MCRPISSRGLTAPTNPSQKDNPTGKWTKGLSRALNQEIQIFLTKGMQTKATAPLLILDCYRPEPGSGQFC